MSEHKYHVGQAVEFFPQRGVEHTAKGRFKVLTSFAWRAQCASLSDPTRSGRARADGRRKRARPTVIWRLRMGQPKVDRAHPAPPARQIAQKSRCQTVFASNGLLERAIISRVFPSRGPPAGTALPGQAPIIRKSKAGCNPSRAWAAIFSSTRC